MLHVRKIYCNTNKCTETLWQPSQIFKYGVPTSNSNVLILEFDERKSVQLLPFWGHSKSHSQCCQSGGMAKRRPDNFGYAYVKKNCAGLPCVEQTLLCPSHTVTLKASKLRAIQLNWHLHHAKGLHERIIRRECSVQENQVWLRKKACLKAVALSFWSCIVSELQFVLIMFQ